MSKKKASGNTMTLKDFHGGSIPSDLPLPSAPGAAIPRPNYDRSAPAPARGNQNHRSRPHTSASTWQVDDKAPFLTQSVHIGRNFDEDERTPLDGMLTPRRPIRDDIVRVAPAVIERKPLFNAGNGGRGGGGGAQLNTWGVVRKEVGGGSEAARQPVWSGGQSGVVKLANASALDKVSSGRWQSKPSMQYQQMNSNIEVARPADTEFGIHSRGYGSVERQSYDGALARHIEQGLQIDDGNRNSPVYEGARGLISLDVRERKPTLYSNRVQPAQGDGRYGQTEVQPFAYLEPVDRPKLKLLPRTWPVDHLGAPVCDHTQEYQHPVHVETVNEVYGNMNSTKPGSASSETVKVTADRPKLNLKPLSQPLDHLDVIAERERDALFGGARPRELVLKARGVDDVVINESDMVQHTDKVEHRVQRADHPRDETHSPKPDRVTGHANPTGHPDRDAHPFDLRIAKQLDRRDSQVERADMQNRNWRNDGRKNNRETDRQPQQSERPRSPETWWKPEQPKPSTPGGAAGLHYGKTASALELAQAFSRSVSDPKSNERISAQKGIPTRGQVPFSRLTGPTPTPRSQLNGY